MPRRIPLVSLAAAAALIVAAMPATPALGFAPVALPAHTVSRALHPCAHPYGQGSVLPCAVHSRHRSRERVLRYIGHGEILSVWPDGNADLILLAACTEEDGSAGPLPCRWDAQTDGLANGGDSFDILYRGGRRTTFVYDDGHREYGGI